MICDSTLVGATHPSPNFGPRRGVAAPDMLLLHYTGLVSVEKAIDWLSRPESSVSCHYVIDDCGLVTQMVAEEHRAWHAGVAHWAGTDDINSCSIGIEIHNPGHEHGLPEYPPAQMKAVLALCRDIISRNGIRPERVLGHSDVAPMRKIDPGERFDWRWLAANGVGLWVPPAQLDRDEGFGPGDKSDDVGEAQDLLASYGYGIAVTGEMDETTTFVVRAFQRHFRPERVDSRLDRSTLATLHRLLAACQETNS